MCRGDLFHDNRRKNARHSIVSPLRAVDKNALCYINRSTSFGASCVSGRTSIHALWFAKNQWIIRFCHPACPILSIVTGNGAIFVVLYRLTRPAIRGWKLAETCKRIPRYILPARWEVLIQLFAKECYGESKQALRVLLRCFDFGFYELKSRIFFFATCC